MTKIIYQAPERPGIGSERIRLCQESDLADVYRVCVQTGDSGGDATGKFTDDDLLPDIYAGPYLALEPELAFVVENGDHVAGYLVATADTRAFVERYRSQWLPRFAAKHPRVAVPGSLQDRVVNIGHHPEHMLGTDLDLFPAHLHIDLLPELQGRGLGRILIRILLAALQERGVPGVQLGVGEQNTGARAFYARLGFRPLPSAPENELALGIPSDFPV